MANFRLPYTMFNDTLGVEEARKLQRTFFEIEKHLITVSGGLNAYDAIIDPELTADDPGSLMWTTVAAALQWWYNATGGYSDRQSLHFGLTGRATSATIVFDSPTAATGCPVVETTNMADAWIPPGGFYLEGIRSREVCIWDLDDQTFNPTGTSTANLYFHNLTIKTADSNSNPTNSLDVFASDCTFYGKTCSGTDTQAGWGGSGVGVFVDCVFGGGTRPSGLFCYCDGCHTQGGNYTQTIGPGSTTSGSALIYTGGTLSNANGTTNTYRTYGRGIFIDCGVSTTAAGPNGQVILSVNSPVTANVYIKLSDQYNNTHAPTLTFANALTNLVVEGGPYENITYVSGGGNQTTTKISCTLLGSNSTEGILDITGPAEINVYCQGLIVRGSYVNGTAVIPNQSSPGGTAGALQLIAANRCNLSITGQQVSGSRKAYAIDASSANNLITYSGHGSFTTAGTDAGAGNLIIRPETGLSGGGPTAPSSQDFMMLGY